MDWTGLGLGLGMPGMTRQELADLYTLAKQRYVAAVSAASGNPSRTAQLQALATNVAGYLNNAAITAELTRGDVPLSNMVAPEIEAAANAMNLAAYDLETMAINWANEGKTPVPPEAVVAAEAAPAPSATFTTAVETPAGTVATGGGAPASSESVDRANLMPTGPVATPAAPAAPAAPAVTRADLTVQPLPEVPSLPPVAPPEVVSQREPGVPLWMYVAGGAGLLVAGVGGTWLWMRVR